MTLYNRFIIDCFWDPTAGLWRASNMELPLVDSAPSYEQLCRQVNQNAPNIAKQSGFINADFVMVRRPVNYLA